MSQLKPCKERQMMSFIYYQILLCTVPLVNNIMLSEISNSTFSICVKLLHRWQIQGQMKHSIYKKIYFMCLFMESFNYVNYIFETSILSITTHTHMLFLCTSKIWLDVCVTMGEQADASALSTMFSSLLRLSASLSSLVTSSTLLSTSRKHLSRNCSMKSSNCAVAKLVDSSSCKQKNSSIFIHWQRCTLSNISINYDLYAVHTHDYLHYNCTQKNW